MDSLGRKNPYRRRGITVAHLVPIHHPIVGALPLFDNAIGYSRCSRGLADEADPLCGAGRANPR